VLGVSVEIELKLNWRGLKKVKYFKILQLLIELEGVTKSQVF